ncbi:recombinase family protein [Streptacidiphilus sp. PAMC 29251]
MNSSGTRALLAARISHDTDESTSIERQLEKLHRGADERSLVVVDVVEDRTVSGAVDLKDRPSLGKWLTEEGRSQWDVLLVTTQDRLSRDDLHFAAFVGDMLRWGKQIIILDDPSLDLSTVDGRMIANIKAGMAAKELEKIKQRITDSRDFLRRKGRWGGGVPPFGYVGAARTDGTTEYKTLVQEPQYAELMRGMSERIRGGISTQVLARELNAAGTLAWRDRLRILAGREAKGTAWTPAVIQRIFKHPSCAGFLAYQGKIFEDESGQPVMITDEPILKAWW